MEIELVPIYLNQMFITIDSSSVVLCVRNQLNPKLNVIWAQFQIITARVQQ